MEEGSAHSFAQMSDSSDYNSMINRQQMAAPKSPLAPLPREPSPQEHAAYSRESSPVQAPQMATAAPDIVPASAKPVVAAATGAATAPATEEKLTSQSPVAPTTLEQQRHHPLPTSTPSRSMQRHHIRQNHVTAVSLVGVSIVCLFIDGQERLCLAQISNTLLKEFSYNEIHNRRVALGITCVQCTPVQLEILRRAGAMPISSRRCGMITKREAERLVKSFLEDISPPKLPENFAFDVRHECGWGCQGNFIPSRYNSSRAKCIKCTYCNMFFSPNKFIFHFHRTPESKYTHPDAANFNSWRRHLKLDQANASDDLSHAWEDVKAMFNGGTRKRVLANACSSFHSSSGASSHRSHNLGSHGSNMIKRQKMEEQHSPNPGPVPPGLPHPAHAGTPYPQYPVFPVPNKMAPLKNHTIAPAHPAFTLPFGYDKPIPPPENAGNMKSSPPVPWNNIHETLYPPYEMIWARHLGLSATENGLTPAAYAKLSPSTTRTGPVPAPHSKFHPSSSSRPEVSQFKSVDSLVAKDNGCMAVPSANHHLSAFTAVGGGGGEVLHARDHDLEHRGEPLQDHQEERAVSPAVDDANLHASGGRHHPDLQNGSDSDSDSEQGDVDVDTIDDDERRGGGVGLPEEENNNVCLQKNICSLPIKEDLYAPINSLSPRNIHPEDKRFAEQSSCGPVQPPKQSDDQPDADTAVADESTTSDERDEDDKTQTSSEAKMQQQQLPPQPEHHHQQDAESGHSDTEEGNFAQMSKEQLQRELLTEIQARQKLEEDSKLVKDTFQEQVDREKQNREEMSKQLQLVRETLCHELDQERKARFSLQSKLKEAHDALHSFSCNMLAARQCADCEPYKEPVLPR